MIRLVIALGIVLQIIWNQNSTAAEPLWQATLEGDDWLTAWKAKPSWGIKEKNCTVVDKVLRVSYPKGSASPAVTKQDLTPVGGAQWYARPLPPQDELCLRYEVRFVKPFDFVKGGKLPGLFGGTEASGGKKPDGTNGFSTRYMWRAKGEGELYAYLFGHDDPYGVSLAKGKWRFFPGQWHTLEQRVKLNTPGKKDGILTVWIDRRKILDETNVEYRTDPKLQIEGIFFSTFFGGNDVSWAAKADSAVEFRNITLDAKPSGK
jgi:hypothetical protein